MNTQISSPSPSAATPTLPAELIGRLANAYGDTDSALVARALAVNAAVAFGSDVKSMARDLADAHRANHAIPAVSAATLGYAKFAGTVAEMTGASLTTWAKREKKMVADTVRAVKRVGVKVATAALREALHGVDGPVAREQVAGEVVERLLGTILPAPAESAPRSAAGIANGDAPTDALTAQVTGVSTESTSADVLATVHALTQWFARGGVWSPDMGSALAQLADAASSARKRGQSATAKLAPLTGETVAA